MKYSLRSLMIGITLFCVALGVRVEYLRRMAACHRREAKILTDKLGFDPTTTELTNFSVFDPDDNNARLHTHLAGVYSRAVFRPWMPVDESLPMPHDYFDP